MENLILSQYEKKEFNDKNINAIVILNIFTF